MGLQPPETHGNRGGADKHAAAKRRRASSFALVQANHDIASRGKAKKHHVLLTARPYPALQAERGAPGFVSHLDTPPHQVSGREGEKKRSRGGTKES